MQSLWQAVAEVALKEELAYATAKALAARNRRRGLSPVEVVEAYVGRICWDRNPALNASVYEDFRPVPASRQPEFSAPDLH